MWIEHLFLEAEALNLVEVLASIEWHHIVGRYSNDWSVSWVLGCVEGKSGLTWVYLPFRVWNQYWLYKLALSNIKLYTRSTFIPLSHSVVV